MNIPLILRGVAGKLPRTRIAERWLSTSSSISLSFLSTSQETTHSLGLFLGSQCHRGDVIFLRGALGAGKSVLARGIVRGAANDEELEVLSPTFLLLQSYSTPSGLPITHIDAYRLPKNSSVEFLGLEESYRDGVTLIEWAERLPPSSLPSSSHLLLVSISREKQDKQQALQQDEEENVLDEDTIPRVLTFSGSGERAAELTGLVKRHLGVV